MFVDMIDSLAAIRDIDPEEAQELFSKAIGLMSEAVHSCAGTVVRTLGDGIMALFGAPAAREDHALAACHAALKILKGAGDADVLAWAGDHDRIVVTHDRSTMPKFAVERIKRRLAMPGLFVVNDRTTVRETSKNS